jgi:UDP-N-acetylmuramate dehydrogenase
MNKRIIKELRGIGTPVENAPLAARTSFLTGGPADILFWPMDTESVSRAIIIARDSGMRVTIIGGGSNILVSDHGVRGLVIRIADDGPYMPEIKDLGNGLVSADARLKKEDFIKFAVNRGYGGVEFMAGIPGCVGGGMVMNAGTTDGCFADILTSADAIDLDGNIRNVLITDAKSGYRNMGLAEGLALANGCFKLPLCDDLDAIQKRIRAVIAGRWEKHPMGFPSAGSVFKNPPENSSWKLIDGAGLKGMRVGGAAVSEIHTNFIVNNGGASSSDIRGLIMKIQTVVEKKFGILLETEIRMIGDF